MRILKLLAASLALFPLLASCAAVATHAEASLDAVIASELRNPNAVARDAARHPAAELRFFGLSASQNVVELWPGGGYWTEILGPYLAAHGQYTAALAAASDPDEGASINRWRQRIAAHQDKYGKITETLLDAKHFDIAAPGSADLIVTFRNLHNWIEDGSVKQVLAACLTALKPGGILGIEDHRGRNDRPQDGQTKDGYVRQDYAIELVKAAGFEFVSGSEINANPRDTKDWAEGVWTLPPTLTLGDKDRAKYVAIGEADNFVLKFRKPKH
jgi:predicted methyltransferase